MPDVPGLVEASAGLAAALAGGAGPAARSSLRTARPALGCGDHDRTAAPADARGVSGRGRPGRLGGPATLPRRDVARAAAIRSPADLLARGRRRGVAVLVPGPRRAAPPAAGCRRIPDAAGRRRPARPRIAPRLPRARPLARRSAGTGLALLHRPRHVARLASRRGLALGRPGLRALPGPGEGPPGRSGGDARLAEFLGVSPHPDPERPLRLGEAPSG